MIGEPTVTLELDDIQAALVHPRPTRYAGDRAAWAHRQPARRP